MDGREEKIKMRITILYDNEVYKTGLESGWGFSCLVECSERSSSRSVPKILFDTGANGTMLLRNMEKLHIKPRSIAEVFISHAHRDHTGGLADFLQVNETATVYVPSSCSKPSQEVVAAWLCPAKELARFMKISFPLASLRA